MSELFTRLDRKYGSTSTPGGERRLPLHVLHDMECEACPLNRVPARHPKMKPTGSKRPLVYILGEAPGADEDERGVQFVGQSGKILRRAIPKKYEKLLRWNNCVRTRPPGNRTPSQVEVECCRPSVERDIAERQPVAIFGFGNIPLAWATGLKGITAWRGRRIPVTIKGYTCWFYPMVHPAFVLRESAKRGKREDAIGPEWENQFVRDLRRALREVRAGGEEPVVESDKDYDEGIRVVTEPSVILRRLDRMADLPEVTVDFEMSALRPFDGAKLLTVSVGTGDDVLAYPVQHSEAGMSRKDRKRVLTATGEFLQTEHTKIAHNARTELEWVGFLFGAEAMWRGFWECTQAQAYIIDERVGAQSLDALCLLWFGVRLKMHSGVNRKALADADLSAVLKYNGRDVKYTHRLFQAQRHLIQVEGLAQAYECQRQRVAPIVEAQLRGLDVDYEQVEEWSASYSKRLRKFERKIEKTPEVAKFRTRFGEFNPSSERHVSRLFKDVLQRSEVMTKDGRVSTEAERLLATKTAAAELIVGYRKTAKVLSTYVKPLVPDHPKSVLWSDGRLHTSFNMTFTSTGRLSSDGPNMHNFPKRGPERAVRALIVAPPGHVMVSADFGQIEYRVFGMASLDRVVVESCSSGYDVHMAWAERIAELHPKSLSDHGGDLKQLRGEVKNKLVFPAFYGAYPGSIGASLSLPSRLVDRLFGEFWEMFAGVKKWQERQIEFYNKHGYVECLTGRRRRGPLSKNMILNSPIQGTAAEILVDAMYRLAHWGRTTGRTWAIPVLNIHDDLTFYMPDDSDGRLDARIRAVVKRMVRSRFKFVNVPLSVEVSVGPNWSDLKEYGVYRSDKEFPHA